MMKIFFSSNLIFIDRVEYDNLTRFKKLIYSETSLSWTRWEPSESVFCNEVFTR